MHWHTLAVRRTADGNRVMCRAACEQSARRAQVGHGLGFADVSRVGGTAPRVSPHALPQQTKQRGAVHTIEKVSDVEL